tara:strand:- start:1357 stop:2991 length:1635 start_codon:yes stop_codon:yes gene_type:complete
MGIFKDFASSGYGDFTVGALTGLSEVGQRDAERNAVFAQDSLNKENAAFKETELAFNNKKQITNIIANNPLAFGITATADLTSGQIADRLTNRIFNEQRSIFEFDDLNKVKMGVAKYLTRPDNLGTGVELTSPYIPSEDLFSAEQEKHSAKLSEISKMPRVDKLLMNVKQAEENVASPEAITDSLTKVASITAKGYGILNTFPGTPEGNTNLKFMQTNIIVANARGQFPNDATARANFIDKKLYDNNIDPMSAVSFQNPVTFKAMSKVLETQGNALAGKISELTNAMAQAPDDEARVQIQNQINQVIMQQYQLINTFSGSAPFALSGKDADKVGMIQQPEIKTEPDAPVERVEPKATPQDLEKDLMDEQPEDISAFQASAVTATPVALANIDDFTNQIIEDEGKPFLKATKVFEDEKNFTIGYGRNNASVKEGDTITLEKAKENLTEDIKVRLEEIQDLIPNFSNLPETLQIALFSEYFRGSIRQSPKTVKLINQGRYQEAAGEFLDNDEYRDAEERGRRGIRGRMKKVFDELNKLALKTTKSS